MKDNDTPNNQARCHSDATGPLSDVSTAWGFDQEHDEQGIQQSNDIRKVLVAALEVSLSELPVQEQLRIILEQIVSISWLSLAKKGAIFLVEDAPDVLVMRAQHELPGALSSMCARVPFGRCLCGRAALSRELVFADRIDDRHDNRYEGVAPHGHYCIPIIFAGELLGVLTLYVPAGHARRRRDVEFLRAVGAVLAGIVKHGRAEGALKDALARLQKALDGAVQAMAQLVEIRDPYTAGHQRRVADLASAIADEMGLSLERVGGIRTAAFVHDIGKVSVPAEILNRPGRLSEAQFSMIREHAAVGHQILKTIEFPWPIAQIVFQHHERMDGSGYPAGLSSGDILLEARILAVADVLEAMASHRPYRPAHSTDSALQEISRNKGVLYDPDVVDACLRLFQQKGYKLA